MSLSVRLFSLSCVALLVAGACSKTANPAVCCTDPADCASIGAEEDNRPCPTALTCVDHECVVPDCSTQGCSVMEPVCNLASNSCEGCTENADCANFPDQERCLVESGACVQCIMSSDCGPTVPVCANHSCRTCRADTECASGACSEDGTCIADTSIVYVDPLGDDTGECTKATPCRSIKRAVTRTSATRRHIVIAPASYAIPGGAISVSTGETSAPSVTFHGGNASLIGSAGDPIIVATNVPIIVRDLKFQQVNGGAGIRVQGSSTGNIIERVSVESSRGLEIYAPSQIRDVTLVGIQDKTRGIEFSTTTFEMDRVVVRGFDVCLNATGTNVGATIRNTLVFDCATRAVSLLNATGTIEFSTFVTSGAGTGIGARAIDCGTASSLTVRASILWAPGATTPVLQGCNAVSSIVGPTPVAGSSSANPQFVDAAADFRLQTNSPARDALDTGPPTDVMGNQRPINGKFDIGAYEQ